MIRTTIFIVFASLLQLAVAQKKEPAQNTGPRQVAEKQIMLLKNGTLIVRLKTNEKSIAGYRLAGKEKLAEKLELENRLLNQYLMQSFLGNFYFCKLLFIKAKDTKKLLNGEPYLFLNEKLSVDSSITFTGDSFLMAEYGTAESNMKDNDYNYNTGAMKETGNPASTSALVILDTASTQLEEPFPYFAVVNISLANFSQKHILDNPKKPDEKKTPFDAAVKLLNQRMIKFYNEACAKHGTKTNSDKTWWEANNPNKDANAKVDTLRLEENKTIDQENELKGK